MPQKVRTVLIPEFGLDLEPEFVGEFEVDTKFGRVIAHIVGQVGSRSIMIRATTDGRLHVAAAGTAMEVYVVETGVAAAAYNAGDTFEQTVAFYMTDIFVETNAAEISFRNQVGVWGADKAVPVGFMSIDLIHYGMRIRNRGAGNADYEFTIYR